MTTFIDTYGHVQYRQGQFKAEARCDIPGCTLPRKYYVIDHCHEHGWIRGNICGSHNNKLGDLDAARVSFRGPGSRVVGSYPDEILGRLCFRAVLPGLPDECEKYRNNCPDCASVKRRIWGISTTLSLLIKYDSRAEYSEIAPDSVDLFYRLRQRKSGLLTCTPRSKVRPIPRLTLVFYPQRVVSTAIVEYSVVQIEYEGTIHALDASGNPVCGGTLTRPIYTTRSHSLDNILNGSRWCRLRPPFLLGSNRVISNDICENCYAQCRDETSDIITALLTGEVQGYPEIFTDD